ISNFSIHPLFFYCPPPHPDLHSFPTRRSSDLRSQVLVRQWTLSTALYYRSPGARSAIPGHQNKVSTLYCDRFFHILITIPTILRSEEHTSELQSQSNLVCRLLLEKKKKQSYIH